MEMTSWSELSRRTRRLILVAGALDATLRIAALVDLRRRPASEVRGPKRRWAVALVLGNTMGALPLAYFVRGRTPARH
ncbi:hypothetical protein V3N99_10205 [Dermatophilaceae bacterium Soc4.6]